jgi:hypothetical protein
MKTEIYLGKVHMASVKVNAGVFYGENTVQGWQIRAKSNAGLGRLNGDGNIVASHLNFVDDPDLFDMTVRQQNRQR